jgi:transposase InsO family protein
MARSLDVYSRAVVGWAMAERITRDLVIAALTMAVWRRRPAPGLIAHSDRGSQYASGDYQATLELHGFLCSMSRKGNCYDNAAMESFFHSLKVEQVHDRRYRTRKRPGPTSSSISRPTITRSGGTRPWITCHPGISRIGRPLNEPGVHKKMARSPSLQLKAPSLTIGIDQQSRRRLRVVGMLPACHFIIFGKL